MLCWWRRAALSIVQYTTYSIHAMVSHFGAIFSPVASGTVVVCKNNTTVLGRSGQAGARQKKSKENTSEFLVISISRWHVPPTPTCPDKYAKQRPHNMTRCDGTPRRHNVTRLRFLGFLFYFECAWSTIDGQKIGVLCYGVRCYFSVEGGGSRSSISSSTFNFDRIASFLSNLMVAEILASACSLLSCFICIFFSSLSIAADCLFLIPTNLFLQ